MRNIYLSLFFVFLIISCKNDDTREQAVSSDVQVEEPTVQSFGEVIQTEQVIEASELLALLHSADSVETTLKGTVKSVCQKKGCWMDIDLGEGKTMKVRFKDYGFFVPKDISGQTAIIHGTAFWDTTDVELLKHYAQDNGEPQEVIDTITTARVLPSFTADGVLLAQSE